MERIGDLDLLSVLGSESTPQQTLVKPNLAVSDSSDPQAETKTFSTGSTSKKYVDRDDANELWSEALTAIETKLEPSIFSAWIKPLQIGSIVFPVNFDDAVVVELKASNRFSRDYIQGSYGEIVSSALAKLLSAQVKLVFLVDESLSGPRSNGPRPKLVSAPSTNNVTANTVSTTKSAITPAQSTEQSPHRAANLNGNYNFSNFIVGSCNQLAHAVGLRVSETLGGSYNPLFIYGGVGLGKTHLANAIGNAAIRRSHKVLLVSSETFIGELISSLRNNRMDSFKQRFRSLDLLIIDDIQFIIGKERTQEEFFHTFNELYNRGKQIIITCDKTPLEMVGLEDRLKTRFASGLAVDLQVPDFETRLAILGRKAETLGLQLNDDILRLVAGSIDSNVRELEGALNRIHAVASLQNFHVDIALTEKVLKTLSVKKPSVELSAESIQRAVAEKYNIGLADLLGKRRTANVAQARALAMYLCRRLTGYSFPEIGAFFGGRDHSTVIHAHKTVTEKMGQDSGFAEIVAALERQFTIGSS
jgi:chromosomal replication initiator protein